MAYIRETTARSFIGLSYDIKPYRGRQTDGSTVSSTDLPQGSTFLELDTGNTAVFNATDNKWDYVPRPPREDVVDALSVVASGIKETNDLLKQIVVLLAST